MPGGIVNKNTILIFSNSASLASYIPNGKNRIGFDKSTGNYYIFNGSKWILFKENVTATKDIWWPVRTHWAQGKLSPTQSFVDSITQNAYCGVPIPKFANIGSVSSSVDTSLSMMGIAVVGTGSNTFIFSGSNLADYVFPGSTGSMAVVVSASTHA